MNYLANAFSPSMLPEDMGVEAQICNFSVDRALSMAHTLKSIISHEITASIISAACGKEIEFNREKVILAPGDSMIVIAPKFRAEIAREFTAEEVRAAGFRAFIVLVKDDKAVSNYEDGEEDTPFSELEHPGPQSTHIVFGRDGKVI